MNPKYVDIDSAFKEAEAISKALAQPKSIKKKKTEGQLMAQRRRGGKTQAQNLRQLGKPSLELAVRRYTPRGY